MKCYICNKFANIRLQKNRHICDNCFVRQFEKRVRKYTRVNEIFQKKDRILAVGEIAKFMLESIAKDYPIDVFYANNVNNEFVRKNKINKILVEWTLDDEINEYLLYWIEKKHLKKQDKKLVKLLLLMTDNESVLFAKIRGLKFIPKKKDKKVQEILSKMEAKHPQARYTFFKNASKLFEMVNL